MAQHTRPAGVEPGAGVRPSPIFYLVVAATAVGAWLCTTDHVSEGVAVFVFVAAGWILSLIFHEFAHAYIAWRGGDHSVAARGYLSLDPRRYTDPLTSLGIPIILLLAGGIGLPGGAVWINRRALRSPLVASVVSLAGPATNLALAAVCLGAISTDLVDANAQPVLATAVAFLGFLQVTAFVLNMLPVPGLDGFGAIEPHLPPELMRALAPARRWGLLVLFGLLWFVEPVNRAFWDVVLGFLDSFAVDRSLVRDGFALFQFWE